MKPIQSLILLFAIASLAALTTLSGCASARTGKRPLTDTERARMLIEVANGALTEGDPTGALVQLLEAEKLDPGLPELHHAKAVTFFMKKDLKTAIQSARKAVALKPDYSEANNTLGKLLMDAGDLREAEGPLLKAANDPIFREAYKAHTSLGILYYRQGKTAPARESLARAVDEFPMGACIAHYYLGHLSLQSGDFQGATAEYERATRNACASFADAHLAAGIAYERSRQFDKARKKFLDIKQNFPDTSVASQAMEHLRGLP